MRISIGLPNFRAGRRRAMDLSSVPAESTQTAGKVVAMFLMVFGLVWGGIPVAGLIYELDAGRARTDLLLFLVFPAIGTGIVLLGLHLLLWRRTIAYDGTAFTVIERGLRGTRRWREAVSAFVGVVRRTRRVKTKNSSYTLYMVDLVHNDGDRTINLYTDTREGDLRRVWEDYARQLNVPALEDAAGGILKRSAEDLAKSVADLIAEGKVDIDYDTLTRPVPGLAVGLEGDDVLLTRTGPRNSWWGSLIAVLFPLVFVAVGFQGADMPLVGRILFGGVGLLFELIFVLGVVNDLTTRQRLRVGPGGVRVCTVSARGETKGKRIDPDAIESVSVAAPAGKRSHAVLIASDAQTLKFGVGLPPESLEFAVNTVLAKIAETARRRT